MNQIKTPINILLVEDDHLQVEMALHLFKRLGIVNTIHSVDSGEKALDFIHRRPPFETAPRPALVLLDLNLPGLSGHQVLDELDSDPALSDITAVMLTVSKFGKDMLKAHDAGAAGYLVKPVTKEGITALIEQLGNFELAVVERGADGLSP